MKKINNRLGLFLFLFYSFGQNDSGVLPRFLIALRAVSNEKFYGSIQFCCYYLALVCILKA